MLKILEKSHSSNELNKSIKDKIQSDDFQLSFIQLDDPLLHQIKSDILNINIDILTPVEALMKLNEIKKMLGGWLELWMLKDEGWMGKDEVSQESRAKNQLSFTDLGLRFTVWYKSIDRYL